MATSIALLSVSDKTGIVELAQGLIELNIQILATGGTAALLKENNIAVQDVADFTGAEEILGGRVKSLHPKIYAGILAQRDKDASYIADSALPLIDYVVTNLYPFEATITQPDCTLEAAVEKIDIGGPSMIRAAAKNFRWVSVLTDPNDYPTLLAKLQTQGEVSEQDRFDLAQKAFEHVAYYDDVIANYFGSHPNSGENQHFPVTLNGQWRKIGDLRYGENPHQQAAAYRAIHPQGPSIVTATQHQGKALSYNNIADADAALRCLLGCERTACVIVKHENPCGVAESDDLKQAYQLAYQTDPTSAFGGIIAMNQIVEADTAEAIVTQQFSEVILAPAFSKDALEIFTQKPNIRILSFPNWSQPARNVWESKRILGGLLIQSEDNDPVLPEDFEVVTKRQPTEEERKAMQFAWRVCKYVKSNAIVYSDPHKTLGIGAGQMSRVFSARIAADKAAEANLSLDGTAMASDAFFPFPDAIDVAASQGIRAIIQPGGSKNDANVIAAADAHGITMLFTRTRHFRH